MFLNRIIKTSCYCFFLVSFLASSGNISVWGEVYDGNTIKEIIITQRDYGYEKQSSSSIKVLLDTQQECHVKNIQGIELHTSDGTIYQFDSTEFY